MSSTIQIPLSIPSMCTKDCEKVQIIFEDWLTFDHSLQRESSEGWEPMWGDDGVFNGMLQQGDCGERMCSRACAEIGSKFLNNCSQIYVYNILSELSKDGKFRGACNVGETCCGWCNTFRAGNTTDEDNCEMCGCQASTHALIEDIASYVYDRAKSIK